MSKKYLLLEDGTPTTSDDPNRGIWYSAAMTCGYWTDDWNKLKRRTSGIPGCPHCGCVGMQTIAQDWFTINRNFLEDNPRYDEWLPTSKEHCGRTDNIGFMASYHLWLQTRRENEDV